MTTGTDQDLEIYEEDTWCRCYHCQILCLSKYNICFDCIHEFESDVD